MAAAFALVAGAACSGPEQDRGTGFWQRAAPPVRITLEPPPAPGAPGVVARHRVDGVVRGHLRRPSGGAASELRLLREDGALVILYYDLGPGRWLPLDPGDPARVHVLIRRHTEDEGADVGLMVWQLPPAAAEAENLARVVAVVESRRVLEDEAVPALLRGIAPTRMAAYSAAGRFGVECDETHQHSWFRFGRTGTMRDVQGRRHPLDPRLVSPGSYVLLADGDERWNVQLIDNRSTTRSLCKVPSEQAWSWAAIAAPVDKRLVVTP
ncbi:MAG: hypothetical protein H6747_03770 [Deltaproteobacteria bacterium]|nr:hypothetical protein [Deltaproteobacteria bacterium]